MKDVQAERKKLNLQESKEAVSELEPFSLPG